MTNENKLKQLLIIATNNGWKSELSKPYDTCEVVLVEEKKLRYRIITTQNIGKYNYQGLYPLYLDQLIGNSYPEEIGFIEGLCNAHNMIENYAVDSDCYNTYLDLHVNIIKDFFIQKDSNKLEFLFETFNHLL
jgi:hypothetical protein